MTAAVSVVSGGSRGVGLALVEAFLARGDRVATFSRSGSGSLDALSREHRGRLYAARVDGSDPVAVRAFVADVVGRFGGVDHCVANAAVAHEGVLATVRDDEIAEMVGVNVTGSIVFVRECVRQMLLGSAAGRTVTLLSSVVASRGSPGLAVYAATKAALEGFGTSLARELGPRGIRVNTVAPGFLVTDLSASLSPGNRDRIAARSALARLGVTDDVVGVIGFLTGAAAAFVSGQIIAVDGGA
jgi:3-oxoacyl-[acyl-carrier protein] reductase